MTTATKYGSWALTADPPDGVGAALAEALAERGLNVVQLSCQLISLCRKTSHHSTLPRSAMSSHRPSTIPTHGPTWIVGEELRAAAQRRGDGRRNNSIARYRRVRLGRHTMDEVTVLSELEAIKKLKARYCRFLDTKDWTAWRQIFADDFVSDTTQAGGKVIAGADEFVAYIRKTLGKASQPTVHHVHAPEIELTSPTTARGVWALQDVVRLAPGLNLNGYGHYHETYEKIDGQWLIKTSTLTRLREDVFNPLISVRVSERVRNAAAKAARRRTH